MIKKIHAPNAGLVLCVLTVLAKENCSPEKDGNPSFCLVSNALLAFTIFIPFR